MKKTKRINNHSTYLSPLGPIDIVSDGEYLIHLNLPNQHPFTQPFQKFEDEVIALTKSWLDTYFSGIKPTINIPLKTSGTPFQQKVWSILLSIPYGSYLEYGQIAKRISPTMSSQAIGQAVSKNPLAIIIPCHRVLGKNNKLTGYQGGLALKKYLLNIENIFYQGEENEK